MNMKNIHWIAGLLEGEGCFAFNGSPRLLLQMTDEDIVSKFRSLTAPENKIRILVPGSSNRTKTVYNFCISGRLAIEWMMTLYPLMGRRRKERIREVIQEWKKMTSKTKEYKRHVRNSAQYAIELIAMSRKITKEEARKIYHETVKVN